jgi:hypothetical protein
MHKGLLKHGVHPEDHTVVYSSKTDGPYFRKGEEKLLKKNKPIRFDMKDGSEKLDPFSRMNYTKTYTVEHNVKVYFIGRVNRKHEHELAKAFNQANPLLELPPYHDGDGRASPDALTGYSQGANAGYQSDTHQYPSYAPTPNTYIPPVSQPYNPGVTYAPDPPISQSGGYQEPSTQNQYHQPDQYQQPRYDDGYDPN